MEASRSDLMTGLHDGGRARSPGASSQTRTRNPPRGLDRWRCPCSSWAGSTLLLGSFSWLHRQLPGISRRTGVFVASVTLPHDAISPRRATRRRLFLHLAAETRAAPGVKDAALIQGLLLGGAGSRRAVARADGVGAAR